MFCSSQDYVKLENQDEEGLNKAFADAEADVDLKLQEDEVIKEVSGNMVELMSMDPDPKFQNSQFLQFLSKLKTGEFKIEKNQLIVNEQMQQQNLENAFETAQQNVEEMKSAPLEENKSSYYEEEQNLQTAWNEMHEVDDEDEHSLSEIKPEVNKMNKNTG